MEKLTATCLLLALLVGLSVSTARPYDYFQSSSDTLIDLDPLVDLAAEPDVTVSADPVIEMNFDTLPSGNRNGSFTYDDGNKHIEAKIKDNKIVRLKIDGTEIPESELSNYEDMLATLMASVPEPPLPPTPPSFEGIAMPPTPPSPPTPANFFKNNNGKVKRQKDKDGNTTITIEDGNGEQAVIEIKKSGKVFMNGKEMKEGEEAAFGKYFGAAFDNAESWDMNEDTWRAQEIQIAKAKADWAKQEAALQKQEEEWRKNEEKWQEMENSFQAQAKAQEKLARSFATGGEHPDWKGVDTYVVEAVGNDDIRKSLEKELLKDGLIKNVSNYKLDITSKTVKVNDKELPAATAKKYIGLYEQAAEFKLRSNSRYQVNRKAEE